MLLSEKEIAKILKKHTCYEGPHVSSFDRIGAARAIAEKLAEGVAWSDQFKAEVEERPGYEFDYVVLRKDDSVVRSLMHKGIKDGQRVRVTVTKEEGDADTDKG